MAVPLVPGWRCCAYHAPRQRAEVQPTHLSSRCAPISTAGAGSCATTAPWSGWCVAGTACEPAEARTALPAWECRQGRMQRCQCASTGSAAGQMPSGPAIDAAVQLTRSCPSRTGASDALLARQPSGPEKVQALAKGHERSLWSGWVGAYLAALAPRCSCGTAVRSGGACSAALPLLCVWRTPAPSHGAPHARLREQCASRTAAYAPVPAGHIDLRSSEFYVYHIMHLASAACRAIATR